MIHDNYLILKYSNEMKKIKNIYKQLAFKNAKNHLEAWTLSLLSLLQMIKIKWVVDLKNIP